jgi:DNA topoisomerase II
MAKKSEPDIKEYDGDDFTCITFEPDFHRFGMTEYSDDEI